MGYVIRMPQMGMSMDEGTVVSWEIEEGTEVEEGEVIVIVESEKSANDVEAREDGVLRETLVSEGTTVDPGDPIGVLAGPDEELAPYLADIDVDVDQSETDETTAQTASSDGESVSRDSQSAEDTGVRAAPGARKLAEEEGVDLSNVSGSGPGGAIIEDDVEEFVDQQSTETPEQADSKSGGTVKASPGAKQLANEKGLELSGVAGSGPGGAIIEDDVRDAIAESGVATADTQTDTGSEPSSTTVTVSEVRELSGLQQTISKRLGQSDDEAVHVTLNRTFDTSTMQSVQDALTTLQFDVSIADFLLKASATALREHPEFNAHFEEGNHKLIEETNIGLAIDHGEGLVTPVIGNVDQKRLTQVAKERQDVTQRIAQGEYTMDDMQGGVFTISNLGVFGVDHFDPVINPPEIAILGVGRIREDGAMTLSLSFDHRVVNGTDAARFLGTIVEELTTEKALASYFSQE